MSYYRYQTSSTPFTIYEPKINYEIDPELKERLMKAIKKVKPVDIKKQEHIFDPEELDI